MIYPRQTRFSHIVNCGWNFWNRVAAINDAIIWKPRRAIFFNSLILNKRCKRNSKWENVVLRQKLILTFSSHKKWTRKSRLNLVHIGSSSMNLRVWRRTKKLKTSDISAPANFKHLIHGQLFRVACFRLKKFNVFKCKVLNKFILAYIDARSGRMVGLPKVG